MSTTSRLDRTERRSIAWGRSGFVAIGLGFLAYGIGIWTLDSRWGWTGLLLDVVGLIAFAIGQTGLAVVRTKRAAENGADR